MPVLVIDVGNSSTAIGAYARGRVLRVSHVEGGVRRQPEACAAALRKALGGGAATGAMLGSVVPATNPAWRRLLRREARVATTLLHHDLRLPVRLDYPHPETTGADRLANVSGAIVRYGAPLMVVDIGTAITYDLVAADGRFFTGVIAPGPRMMAQALHHYTALLPPVTFDGHCPRLPRDTAGAMRLGVEVGCRGAIRETVNALLPLLGGEARLIATGGFARHFVDPLAMGFTLDPTLTLFGLGWLYEYQGTP